jgi:hypothetical protein
MAERNFNTSVFCGRSPHSNHPRDEFIGGNRSGGHYCRVELEMMERWQIIPLEPLSPPPPVSSPTWEFAETWKLPPTADRLEIYMAAPSHAHAHSNHRCMSAEGVARTEAQVLHTSTRQSPLIVLKRVCIKKEARARRVSPHGVKDRENPRGIKFAIIRPQGRSDKMMDPSTPSTRLSLSLSLCQSPRLVRVE